MKYIDQFLNSITMYQLVLRVLQVLVLSSLVLSAVGILSFSIFSLIYSFLIITTVSYFSNSIFAKVFNVQTNNESFAITAYIIFLIVLPPMSLADASVIALIAFLATASKYVLNIGGRHIFNPAAIALVIIGLLGFGHAIWWVGSAALLPITIIGGLLIVKKIRRFPLVLSFLCAAYTQIALFSFFQGTSFNQIFIQSLVSWPLIFFGTVMLTEPATMPSSRNKQIIYGVIIGLLFGSQWNIGPLFASPELALSVGNLFAYLASYRPRMRLYLKEKNDLSATVKEFVFSYSSKKVFTFLPGQYMEWTHVHSRSDSRGNRRYFTISSSPTEKDIKIGIRIQEEAGSSFKNSLLQMKEGDELFAQGLAGDFVLPTDTIKKLGFIAGGIGITPFRSMIKYCVDKQEKRDVVLFYSATKSTDFVYKDIFSKGEEVGVLTKYAISVPENIPKDWNGIRGGISKESITNETPDYMEREWYISGPNLMVEAYVNMLHDLGVKKSNIKTDYFPGF